MATTIQISENLLKKLGMMKINAKESYEDIIWDLIEDRMELSDRVKVSVKEYEKDLKENRGKFTSLEKIKKELSIDV